MKFGFISGGSTYGLSSSRKYRSRHDIRYREMLREVVVAEEAGFDFVGWPEQHFIDSVCATAPAPVLYAAAAAMTSRIHLRSAVTVLPINDPIRVAENTAALDIISRGRYEFGIGRSNNAVNLRAFGASPEDSMARFEEALGLILKAFTGEKFTHDGKFWQLPDEVRLVPLPVQRPHPPIYVAASSESSHFSAGQKGLGVMNFPNYQGFAAVERSIKAYRDGQAESAPVSSLVTDSIGLLASPCLCLEDGDRARQEIYPYLQLFTKALLVDGYTFHEQIESLAGRADAIDYLTQESAGVVIGDPDQCIEQIERMRQLGLDEIAIGIDGVPHATIVESLETFGKYVIPHFAGVK